MLKFISKKTSYLFFGLIICLFICVTILNSIHDSQSKILKIISVNASCKIPWNIDPFDEFIMPFLEQRKFHCNSSKDLTFVDKNGVLRVKSIHKSINCYYSWLWRTRDYEPIKYNIPKKLTTKGVKMNSSHLFANVTCCTQTSCDYKNNHYFIPNFNHVQPNKSKPSVIVLVIESLSRLSFLRFMKKSFQAINETHHFQFLKSFHRIEKNSFPNSMALLTGIAMTDEEAGNGYGQFWDNYTFVWNHFKSSGYVTAFIEDIPTFGLFTWYKRGFNQTPTDFYPVPFWSQMYPNGTSDLDNVLKNPNLYCFQKSGSKIKMFLNQIIDFGQKMKDQSKPFFVYSFYGQMTHENFNNFALIDESVSNFLKKLKPLLNNTLIIIMGDHGPRVSGATDSPMGLLETSLPFFAIRLPNILRDKYPHLSQNLDINQERLTTPFDIHQTLLDVASDNLKLSSPLPVQQTNQKAFSIIKQVIPSNRNCLQANINPTFCTCNGIVNIDPKIGYHHVYAAQSLIACLNEILLENGCKIRLKWVKTEKAFYILPKGNEKFALIEKVQLLIVSKPYKVRMKSIMIRKRNSTANDWSSWFIYDPNQKLKLTEYKKNLTQKLCQKVVKDPINILNYESHLKLY